MASPLLSYLDFPFFLFWVVKFTRLFLSELVVITVVRLVRYVLSFGESVSGNAQLSIASWRQLLGQTC